MSPEYDNPTNQPSAAAAAPAAEAESVAEPAIENSPHTEAEGEPAPSAPPAEAADADATSGAPAEGTEEGEASAEAMNELMEQYAGGQQHAEEGQPVEGRVVALTDLGAVVDIGGKTEGLIPAQEFLDTGGNVTVMPGEAVEVFVLNERKDGYVLLSYLKALRRRIWLNIEKSYREHTALSGKVLDRIKGGLVVDIGIRAFLPASQVDLRPTHNLEEWKDREIPCRVMKMNRKRGNVVISRRAVLEEEQKAQREKVMETLVEGAVLTGRVKNMTDYGVFVDLGGLDGLLHVTDLSWARVAKPSDVLTVGEEIEVKVLKFDREKMRVSLGRKQLLPDPWAGITERYVAGTRVQGRVAGISDYGVFVELEPGVEGLVHVSEMSWSKRTQHPSKLVKVGDSVEVVVLDVRPDQRRISLGMKQTLPDPWQGLAAKYPVGTVIRGSVRNLTDFGAFVEIEEGIDGMVHVSDISWTQRIKHPSEALKKGDTVEAKVLKIDSANRRISLGLKQVNDIWGDWFAAHKVGDIVRGRVARAVNFGVFVELADQIEGLCHISEIEPRRGKGDRDQPGGSQKSSVQLETGHEYDFKIVKFEPDQHKIGLSYRAAIKQAERRDMEEYRSSKSRPTATIGDMILSKRNSF